MGFEISTPTNMGFKVLSIQELDPGPIWRSRHAYVIASGMGNASSHAIFSLHVCLPAPRQPCSTSPLDAQSIHACAKIAEKFYVKISTMLKNLDDGRKPVPKSRPWCSSSGPMGNPTYVITLAVGSNTNELLGGVLWSTPKILFRFF